MTRPYAEALPTKTNVFRCQFCCQWNGDERTERYFFNGRDFAEMAQKAHEVGFNGLTIWGEPSSFETNTELSYLAFARFTWDPTLTWDAFVREDLAPRLGGVDAAERYLALTTRLDQNRSLDRAELARIRAESLDATRHPDDAISRRWLWLANRAARREFNRTRE